MLTLPYPPSVNRYWRCTKRGVLRSKEANVYKSTVERTCKDMVTHKLSGDVSVTVNLYRPQRSGDLDNFLKVVLDVVKGCVYDDDKQVVHIQAYRHDDPLNPRIELLFEETDNG